MAHLQKTALFITYDLDESIWIGYHIAIMKDEVIVQIGRGALGLKQSPCVLGR